MRISGARSHFGGGPARFPDLLGRRSLAERGGGMAADAVGALGDVRDGYRDQLLGSCGKRSFGEHALAESAEGCGRPRCEAGVLLAQLARGLRINRLVV